MRGVTTYQAVRGIVTAIERMKSKQREYRRCRCCQDNWSNYVLCEKYCGSRRLAVPSELAHGDYIISVGMMNSSSNSSCLIESSVTDAGMNSARFKVA